MTTSIYNIDIKVSAYIVLSVSPFQVVAPVCHQLFDFFCSKTPELRYFSIGMIPMLLSTYLIVIGHSDKKVRILRGMQS